MKFTDEASSSLGRKVPDLMDYTDGNALVDFNKDLDAQLEDLVGLTDAESCHVRGAVRPLPD